jgi:hypothetical protein
MALGWPRAAVGLQLASASGRLGVVLLWRHGRARTRPRRGLAPVLPREPGRYTCPAGVPGSGAGQVTLS